MLSDQNHHTDPGLSLSTNPNPDAGQIYKPPIFSPPEILCLCFLGVMWVVEVGLFGRSGLLASMLLVGSAATLSSKDDDEALVRAFLKGDQQAFRALYEKYKIIFISYMNKNYKNIVEYETAEDIFHDFFMKVYRNLHTFNFQSSFYNWSIIVLQNELRSVHRYHTYKKRDKRETDTKQDLDDIEDYHIEIPSNLLQNKNLISILEEAINELSNKYKIVIMLWLQEISIKEIADIIHIKENTIKTRIRRSKIFIENYIKDKYKEDSEIMDRLSHINENDKIQEAAKLPVAQPEPEIEPKSGKRTWREIFTLF